jgi:hypothetical protein
MTRWMLIAMLALVATNSLACDDDDTEIDTPSGDIKIDR